MADETLSGPPSREAGRPAPPAPVRQPGAPPFKVFKPGQGSYLRWGTAIGSAIIGGGAIYFVNDQTALLNVNQQTLLIVRVIVATVLVVVGAWSIFWLVGRKRGIVDFMIATEGEMKKVNWSSRREVWGATKVVIFTVLALGFLLFVVDLFFMLIFSGVGVLDIPIWQRWFGGGAEL